MAQYDLYDFSEYSDQLSDKNMAILELIAKDIVDSRRGPHPVVRVSISGHCDVALRIPARDRPAFEMDVSIKRAQTALDKLRGVLLRLGGEGALNGIEMKTRGVGSSQRIHQRPANDTQRRRNRRVVVDVHRNQNPPIHPPVPMPRPSGPEDDRNVVYAATNFRIKLMEGVSPGSALAPFTYSFVVWDTDNNKAAVYGYDGALVQGGGPSSPFSGESDWASFSTMRPLQIDHLGGPATHSTVTLPLSFMMLNIPASSGIFLFSGLGIGFLSAQTGAGAFTFQRGSIRVFKGD